MEQGAETMSVRPYIPVSDLPENLLKALGVVIKG